jgi:urease accessory protein
VTIERNGKPLWFERALGGKRRRPQSAAVLAGQPVAARFWRQRSAQSVVTRSLPRDQTLRGEGGVSLLPGLLVGRYHRRFERGGESFGYQSVADFTAALIGRAAVEPRIWRTKIKSVEDGG